MTDLQKVLDRINRIRSEDRISIKDAKALRELAKSLATAAGALGPKKKEQIDQAIKDAVARKKQASTSTPPPTTTTPPTTPTPTPPPASTAPDDDFDDDDDDYDDPDPSDPIVPAAPPPPTKKDPPKKINIPKPDKRANTTLPENSDDRIRMPDINRKIAKEIERVTLRLISVTKDFIEGGMNFYGIDYIAENEILDEDGNPYYPLPDRNTPGGNSGLSEVRIGEVKRVVERILNSGKKESPAYNYERYLRLFELRYTGTGDPVYRFSLDLSGTVLEDLTVLLVEEDPDLE